MTAHTMPSTVSSLGGSTSGSLSLSVHSSWYSWRSFTTSLWPNCMASSWGRLPHLGRGEGGWGEEGMRREGEGRGEDSIVPYKYTLVFQPTIAKICSLNGKIRSYCILSSSTKLKTEWMSIWLRNIIYCKWKISRWGSERVGDGWRWCFSLTCLSQKGWLCRWRSGTEQPPHDLNTTTKSLYRLWWMNIIIITMNISESD